MALGFAYVEKKSLMNRMRKKLLEMIFGNHNFVYRMSLTKNHGLCKLNHANPQFQTIIFILNNNFH